EVVPLPEMTIITHKDIFMSLYNRAQTQKFGCCARISRTALRCGASNVLKLLIEGGTGESGWRLTIGSWLGFCGICEDRALSLSSRWALWRPAVRMCPVQGRPIKPIRTIRGS